MVAAGSEPQRPGSTYRWQLTPDFGFAEAAGTVGYLADLGVTHAYLSPVLDAVPGSQHGYDVTDHTRIRPELGGEDGFRALAGRLRERGIGIVLDIVPNHMAVPDDARLNQPLWSVLRDGRQSPYAHWFDIDWAAGGGRMLLPVLGRPLEDCLDELRVEPGGGPDGEPALRYYDHVLPLRRDTARLPLRDLLQAQHYRLSWWRDAATELNWRRFFDIATLIGLRVEDPSVFDATHEVIVKLVAEGLVDGLRVDHPDGLADPRGYLSRLSAAAPGAWIVVEKILGPDESLPDDWACAGTTGYDVLRVVDGLFLDPAGADPLSGEYFRWRRRAGDDRPATRFADVADRAKREVAGASLAAEVSRLAALLCSVSPGAGADGARTVLTEVLAAFPVYRAYVHPGEPVRAAARNAIRKAVDGAKRRLPGRLHELAEEVAAAAQGARGADGPAGEFAVRFQQTTGPVLAKGVEDTASYRWFRLASLNEVGSEPDRLGSGPAEFHAMTQRLAADWPATMTTLSTHDTKRQEDVRARLAVLAERPDDWAAQVGQWHERAVTLGVAGASVPAVDPDAEYLLWQTLVGAWPISGERLSGYLTKALREAKGRTSWTEPDEAYEAAVLGLATCALGDPELSRSIAAFVAGIAVDAAVNSLGAKLVQLTMPGVPDVYQGCELAALSLVDPDNRRPVDFARRRSFLSELELGRDLGDGDPDAFDRAKLLVTSRALRLRRARPRWFTGDCRPLAAAGGAAGHVVAFQRGGGAVTVATRLPAGLRRSGGWQDTALPLPRSGWRLGGPADRRRVPGRYRPADRPDGPAARRAASSGGRVTVQGDAAGSPLRVWAPAAERVEAEVAGRPEPMSPQPGRPGWWSAQAAVTPGTRYAFRLDGGEPLADPRSPRQPDGPHGASQAYDHAAFGWTDGGWRGAPLGGAVIYELHVGTFTPEGTLDAAIGRLDHLVSLGVTVVELMPVAAFPGQHNWGYDGIGLWAVHEPYGGPDALKRFVDACHGRGLAVYLDVVYNHVGPGNRLASFGPYFTDVYSTPWGPAVNLDQPGSDEVRSFIVENALMWLRDYHLDGLRLDAVHAFQDQRAVHLLEELATAADGLGAATGRSLVLVAETDMNNPRLITPRQAGGYGLAAQWDDDFHHAVHALITGERQGYYADFGSVAGLAKTLTGAYFHDGTWSSFRERSHGRPVDTQRTPAYQFVVLRAGPRPGRQPGGRATGCRHARRAPAPGRAAAGRRRAGAHRPVHADAVHGRGMGRGHPLAVLHRPHRPVLRRGGQQRAPVRVRRARLGLRRRPRPAGLRDLPALQARLGPAVPRAVRVDAGLVPLAAGLAPRPARADRPAAGPGAGGLRRSRPLAGGAPGLAAGRRQPR